MPRGRIPQPKALNDLKGDPGKRRRNTTEPTPPRDWPDKPDYLDPVASVEWDSVVDLLDNMGLLSSADRAAIEMYCSAYSRYRAAEDNVRKFGEVLVSPKNRYPMVSPYVTTMNRNLETCRKFLLEFGLTPAARARMRTAITKDTGTDELTGYMRIA